MAKLLVPIVIAKQGLPIYFDISDFKKIEAGFNIFKSKFKVDFETQTATREWRFHFWLYLIQACSGDLYFEKASRCGIVENAFKK